MSLNGTPSGERTHIAFFGRRNAGKSSVVNAVTGQDLAVVSAVKGTTTDPVYKAMELLPIGPVMIIDTPGYDDEGALGRLRVQKTLEILQKTDIAILILDSLVGMTPRDQEYLGLFRKRKLPYLIVYNKTDLCSAANPELKDNEISVSAVQKTGIYALKERIAHMVKAEEAPPLAADLVKPGQMVVLVIPIDSSAPKGRIILPQQQVIRELLEVGAFAVCCKETELPELINRQRDNISLVITDSQAFAQVSRDVPEEIPLTSFSILMARHKGFLAAALDGVETIKRLPEGARILIAEGCTHHRQCEDIGTVKLPAWLKEFTGRRFVYDTCSGREFPQDLTGYDLVIHCGGCMLNDRAVKSRMERAAAQGVPCTNYGTAIAYMKGILDRSIRMLRDEEGE